MTHRVRFVRDTATIENGTRDRLLRQTSFSTAYHRNLVPSTEEKSELISAVYAQDEEKVENLLTTVDPNEEVASNFLTPLEIAAGKENVNIVKQLLDKNASMDVRNDDLGSTPLHISVKRKRLETMMLLLRRGASYTARDAKGRRPSDLAAILGHTEIFKNLYEYCCSSASSNVAREEILLSRIGGLLPIHHAAIGGHQSLMTFLLDKYPECFNSRSLGSGEIPLIMAARNGYPECCEILLNASERERQSQLLYIHEKSQTTALIAAAANGHANTVRILGGSDLSFGVDKRNTALHYASQKGFYNTVTALLEMGCNPLWRNSKGDTCLHVAARKKNNTACILALLDRTTMNEASIVNKQGKTFLHIVAEYCCEVLGNIARYDVFRSQINVLDDEGRSPFHIVLTSGTRDALEIMLYNGADLMKSTTKGDLPLHIAARKKTKDICSLLLREEQRITVNDRNSNGATPLHHAIYNADRNEAVAICEYLLHKGASLNIEDNLGFTPLSVAVHNKKPLLVKVFIKHGALKNIATKSHGDNYLHIAARNGDYETSKAIAASKEALLKRPNRGDQLPMQVAFDKNHVDIFKLFLNKVNFNEKEKQMMGFRMKLQNFMKISLEQDKREFIRAMLRSDKWNIVMNRSPTEEICSHFRDLIKVDSGLVCDVMTKCCTCMGNNTTRYSFHFIEDTYITPPEETVPGVVPVFLSPFDEKTGQLTTKCRKVETTLLHPLKIAIEYRRLDILSHRLTVAYLQEKWEKSVFYTYFGLLLVDIISLILQSLSLKYSHDTSTGNSSVCNQSFSTTSHQLIFQYITCIWLFLHVSLEINFIYKLGRVYFRRLTFWLKFIRNFLLLIYLLPLVCYEKMHIKKGFQLPVGCISFLMTSLLTILFIDEIPLFSISLPFSRRFLESFIRAFMHVLFGVLSFALVFYILLSEFPDFSSLYQALIKTSTWLMIDLSYNDTFIEKQLRHPIVTQLIFILFVMTFGLFIINTLVSMPSNNWEEFKEKAVFKRAASRTDLILDLDASFYHHVVQFVVKQETDGKHYFSNLFQARLQPLETESHIDALISAEKPIMKTNDIEELHRMKIRRETAIDVLQNDIKTLENMLADRK